MDINVYVNLISKDRRVQLKLLQKKKTKTTTTTSYPCPEVYCVWQYPCVRWGDMQYYTDEDGNFYELILFVFL